MTSAPGAGGAGFELEECAGHPVRHFKVAVSVTAMALQWVRQESGPSGGIVVADLEVSTLGRLGEPFEAPAAQTLAVGMILRPALPVELGDASWVAGGLVALAGAEAMGTDDLALWWPDAVLAGGTDTVASIKSDVQLGPGQVRSVALSLRFDLAKLGIPPSRRGELLEAVVGSLDTAAGWLAEGPDGCAQGAARYQERCMMMDRAVKVTLRPKGTTRGVAKGVDRGGRLEVTSTTGMVERIGLDQLLRIEVV